MQRRNFTMLKSTCDKSKGSTVLMSIGKLLCYQSFSKRQVSVCMLTCVFVWERDESERMYAGVNVREQVELDVPSLIVQKLCVDPGSGVDLPFSESRVMGSTWPHSSVVLFLLTCKWKAQCRICRGETEQVLHLIYNTHTLSHMLSHYSTTHDAPFRLSMELRHTASTYTLFYYMCVH